MTLTHFECNHANVAGAIAAGGDLVVSRATLECNVAYGDGGAITLFGGNLYLNDSTISGNLAGSRGGGLFLFGYGQAAITNSTISGNDAANGGAIANTYGSLRIANSTICYNGGTDSTHGGGIYFRYAYYPIDAQSSIIAGNFIEDLWPPGMTVTGSHNIVMSAAGVVLPGDTISTSPMLGALSANGGPTLTHAPIEGSPAIDAGSNPLALANDQRGDGYVRDYGAAPDIGAFEVQPAVADRIFADGFDF